MQASVPLPSGYSRLHLDIGNCDLTVSPALAGQLEDDEWGLLEAQKGFETEKTLYLEGFVGDFTWVPQAGPNVAFSDQFDVSIRKLDAYTTQRCEVNVFLNDQVKQLEVVTSNVHRQVVKINVDGKVSSPLSLTSLEVIGAFATVHVGPVHVVDIFFNLTSSSVYLRGLDFSAQGNSNATIITTHGDVTVEATHSLEAQLENSMELFCVSGPFYELDRVECEPQVEENNTAGCNMDVKVCIESFCLPPVNTSKLPHLLARTTDGKITTHVNPPNAAPPIQSLPRLRVALDGTAVPYPEDGSVIPIDAETVGNQTLQKARGIVLGETTDYNLGLLQKWRAMHADAMHYVVLLLDGNSKNPVIGPNGDLEFPPHEELNVQKWLLSSSLTLLQMSPHWLWWLSGKVVTPATTMLEGRIINGLCAAGAFDADEKVDEESEYFRVMGDASALIANTSHFDLATDYVAFESSGETVQFVKEYDMTVPKPILFFDNVALIFAVSFSFLLSLMCGYYTTKTITSAITDFVLSKKVERGHNDRFQSIHGNLARKQTYYERKMKKAAQKRRKAKGVHFPSPLRLPELCYDTYKEVHRNSIENFLDDHRLTELLDGHPECQLADFSKKYQQYVIRKGWKCEALLAEKNVAILRDRGLDIKVVNDSSTDVFCKLKVNQVPREMSEEILFTEDETSLDIFVRLYCTFTTHKSDMVFVHDFRKLYGDFCLAENLKQIAVLPGIMSKR